MTVSTIKSVLNNFISLRSNHPLRCCDYETVRVRHLTFNGRITSISAPNLTIKIKVYFKVTKSEKFSIFLCRYFTIPYGKRFYAQHVHIKANASHPPRQTKFTLRQAL